ncbi:putative RNA helicase [Batrachochytrium dendrobatidis]
MTEYTVPENDVLEILDEVNLAKRIAKMASFHIQLLDKNFGNQTRINKEKMKMLGKSTKRAKVTKKTLE